MIMSRLPGEIKNKVILFYSNYCPLHFSSYYPLQILTSKTCNKDIYKPITVSSLRLGQMKEDGE